MGAYDVVQVLMLVVMAAAGIAAQLAFVLSSVHDPVAVKTFLHDYAVALER